MTDPDFPHDKAMARVPTSSSRHGAFGSPTNRQRMLELPHIFPRAWCPRRAGPKINEAMKLAAVNTLAERRLS